ncbi:hypothetical protein MRX96_008157 [Rhipicephalus microplus]
MLALYFATIRGKNLKPDTVSTHHPVVKHRKPSQRRHDQYNVRHLEDVVVFFCKHAFHSNCLPSLPMCSLCSADKQAQSLGA